MVQTRTQVVGKYTDYQTTARPEDVLEFYRKVMPERGWPTPEPGWATATTEPGWPTPGPLKEFTIHFTYTNVRSRFPLGSAYTQLMVTLTVKATGNGGTSVELQAGL